MTGYSYRRKVGRIKKSLYVNIPSKIAKMLDITRGSNLYVVFQDGKVILSKNPEDEVQVTGKSRPILETQARTGNEIKKSEGFKHLLSDGYEW